MNELITGVNAIICAVIAIRLLAFKRVGDYSLLGAWLAYGMIICVASVPIRYFFGEYNGQTDISELLVNLVLCYAVFRAKGNVLKLFQKPTGSLNGSSTGR